MPTMARQILNHRIPTNTTSLSLTLGLGPQKVRSMKCLAFPFNNRSLHVLRCFVIPNILVLKLSLHLNYWLLFSSTHFPDTNVGWVPKQHLVGMDNKIYILDFFGSKKLRGLGLDIPPSRFLTAYNTSPPNSFLGYFLDDQMNRTKTVKKSQGVIWGKDINHFDGKTKLLKALADRVLLLSTASSRVFHDHNIRWLGHQTPQQWNALLSQSKFLLGLGDPLLGPSAIDAVAAGCMYINPIYNLPVIHNDHSFASQHPHAAETIGEPYVCSYKENDYLSLQKCLDKSMNMELIPYIPLEFTKEAYRKRVIRIFGL